MSELERRLQIPGYKSKFTSSGFARSPTVGIQRPKAEGQARGVVGLRLCPGHLVTEAKVREILSPTAKLSSCCAHLTGECSSLFEKIAVAGDTFVFAGTGLPFGECFNPSFVEDSKNLWRARCNQPSLFEFNEQSAQIIDTELEIIGGDTALHRVANDMGVTAFRCIVVRQG